MRRILQTTQKYVALYGAFFRASLAADVEFRANFLTRIVTDLFWYVAQVASFEVLYTFTPKIGDWSHEQMRVFLGVLFVVDACYMILLSSNLDNFSEKVSKGEIDLLLAKPVNAQFMISLQRANTAILGNLVLGLAWLFWSLFHLPGFSWLRLFWLLTLIPCGLIVFYCMRFAFAVTAIIFTKSENLQYLWYQIYRLGMRPDSIYFPWLKYIVLTIVPVAFIASVPARFLLNPPNFLLFFSTLAISSLALFLSTRFWKMTLRHYSSASS